MRGGCLVVDLFCGMGGFSTGAVRAGGEVVLAIDSWGEALEVHALNHPRCNHIQMELGGDVNAVARLIRKHLRPGIRWHLHGSPPCQSLSSANWRRNERKGMWLVDWYLKLVKLLKPDSWSMEQVRGIWKYLDPHKYDFCEILDASLFGVPQTRKRVYVGDGWQIPLQLAASPATVLGKLPYLAKEGSYLKSYNNNKPLTDSKGKYAGYRPYRGTEGFKTLDHPAFTLCASAWGGGSGALKLFKKHGSKMVFVRELTVQESLVLQGFPTRYRFPKHFPKRTIQKLIGNSLCPIFAFLIIRSAAKN